MAIVTGTALNDTITPTFVSDDVTGMPTAADDVISGLAGDDLLDGGDGDDTLTGGPGHNVFAFATGWGIDIVADVGTAAVTDRNDLSFSDIAFDDVDGFGYRTGDSLGLLYLSTGDAISVPDFYVGGGDWRFLYSDGIEAGPDTDIVSVTTGFGSDGIPDYQQLYNLTIGSPSADTVVLPTTTHIETAYGNLGDDHLTGSGWVSFLVGGGGADQLFSGAGGSVGTYMAGGADGRHLSPGRQPFDRRLRHRGFGPRRPRRLIAADTHRRRDRGRSTSRRGRPERQHGFHHLLLARRGEPDREHPVR